MGKARWKYMKWHDRNPDAVICWKCQTYETVSRLGSKSIIANSTQTLVERFECTCGKSWSITHSTRVIE